jgi:phosphoglycolate phosphatase
MIRALSFDLDGTLIDTAGEIADAVNHTLADFDIAPRPLAEITGLIGNGLRELMMRQLARILLEQPELADRVQVEPVLTRVGEHYAALVGTTAQAYPGALDCLRRLRQAGLRTACVTNKDGAYTRKLLVATGLHALVDVVIAGDTLAQRKPHASVLRSAAAQLKVNVDELVHVGDSRTDIEAAHNAGVAAWAVPYGYNGGEPVARAGPDRLFDHLGDVAAHVLGLHPRVAA